MEHQNNGGSLIRLLGTTQKTELMCFLDIYDSNSIYRFDIKCHINFILKLPGNLAFCVLLRNSHFIKIVLILIKQLNNKFVTKSLL